MRRVFHNGRKVHILRSFPSERVVNQIVLRRAGKIFNPADNVRDFHKVVVDDVCEVVRRHTVGLNKNIVFEFRIIDGNIAVNHIVISARPDFRNILADNVRHAVFKVFFDFFLGKLQAVLVVSPDSVLVGQRFKAFLRAEAVVRPAEFDKFFGVFHIYGFSFALDIRAVVAADVGAFVVSDSRRFERPVNKIYRAVDKPFLVGVLDAKNKRAVIFPCEKKGVKTRP